MTGAVAQRIVGPDAMAWAIEPRRLALVEHTAHRAALSGDTFARVRAFMSRHLDMTIRLPELARLTGLSTSHFSRRFKATTGMSPHQYVIALRVARAQRLLAGSDQPIAEIALDCGFTHQEHLTRLFRRATGTTPALYRRITPRRLTDIVPGEA